MRAFSGTFGRVSTLATFAGVVAIMVASVVPAAPPLLTDLRLQVGLLLLAVLGWRLIAAPFWIHRDAERVLKQLEHENDVLRVRRAVLRPLFRRERPFWIREERRFRVGVLNDGEAAAENVKVHLVDILPTNPLGRDPLPSPIGRKGGGTERVTINPGAMDYFDMIQDVSVADSSPGFITTRGPRTVAVFLEQAGEIQFELDPDTRYEFVTSVSASNAASPVEARLLVRHPRGGQLEVDLIGAAH